jgi:hypothetical protein
MRIFALLFWLLLMGCEAENANLAIVGNWKWVQSKGGIAGLTIKPSEADQRELYELKNAKSITSMELLPMIVFPNEDTMNMSYTIKNDSLFLIDEVYDGFGHTYFRK